MIALLLCLLAGTEPSSSAMTNASRAIEIPREPSRRQRAKAAFTRAEAELEAYFAIEVAIEQRSLERKVEAADAVAARYRAVIAKKDPTYSVAAWVRTAEIYLHFAEQIRRAPGADRDEREAMALGPERRAREALERGRSRAEKHGVRGLWRDRLDRHLDRLRSR